MFGKMSEDPKLGSMLSLKYPFHATHILGGDGDGWRYELLKRYNQEGVERGCGKLYGCYAMEY